MSASQQHLANEITPELQQISQKLLLISNEVGQRPIEFGDIITDAKARADFMALTYVSKQDEHLRSINVLIEAGQHRDAWLIARTMAEGMVQLERAQKSADVVEEWFWFGLIEDWRRVEKNKVLGVGEVISPEAQIEIDKFMSREAPRYYTEKARKLKERGEPLPVDPYRYQWSGQSAKDSFANVGADDLYESLYAATSGWAHWSPRYMHLAATNDSEQYGYKIVDPRNAAIALILGINALISALKTIESRFSVGISNKLKELENEFHQVLDPARLSAEKSI